MLTSEKSNRLELRIGELREELIRRREYMQRVKYDAGFRRDALYCCAASPIYFVNNWGWTYDPRISPHHFPFKLFPVQEECLTWLHKDVYLANDVGLIEKSRDMGATWIVVAFALWGFLFEEGFIARWGSTLQDEVDDMTLDSVFGKWRYMYDHLPPILKPELEINKRLMIKKQGSENTLIGEATTATFGRSGRERITFLDEYAFVRHSEAVWASVSQTANSRCAISTPNGEDNQFYWLANNPHVKKFRLHWKQHPHKDQEWYEEKKSKMKKWQVAQELDIDYSASKEGRIYHRFDRGHHVASKILYHNPKLEQAVSWDFGSGGAMAIGFLQISATGDVEVWNYIEISNQDIVFCLPLSMGYQLPGPEMVQLTHEEREHIEYALSKIPQGHKPLHYGDHSGTAKTANSRHSCKNHIEAAGLKFLSRGKQDHDFRHLCLNELLKLKYDPEVPGGMRPRFQISPDLPRLITCMNNYVWDKDPETGKASPKIDQFSHGVTMLEFFSINRFPVERNKKSTVSVKRFR